MKYKLYYLIESSSLYLSYDESILVDNLNKLPILIKLLQSEEDIVFVYSNKNNKKIKFTLGDDLSLIFEIHDSEAGGIYYKNFKLDDIENIILSFDEFIERPVQFEFNFECF